MRLFYLTMSDHNTIGFSEYFHRRAEAEHRANQLNSAAETLKLSVRASIREYALTEIPEAKDVK